MSEQTPKKPRIIISDKGRGINTREAYGRVMAEPEKEEEKLPTTQPVKILLNINPNEYLQIPNSNYLIAEYKLDWTKGFDYETSHKKVLEQSLEIPIPSLFMQHFVNVINAYQGESTLFDATGSQVQGNRLEDLYKYLTINFNREVWSWLNARFISGTGFKKMDLETVIGIDSKGNLLTKKEPLEKCLMRNCIADIKFNSQGLAVKSSKNQKYKQGKDIYFYYPKNGCVARFIADSGRAYLYCDRFPNDFNPVIGVFTVSKVRAEEFE